MGRTFTNLRLNSLIRKRSHQTTIGTGATAALESRILLAAEAFNGLYAGTFQGTASAFGSTIQIPSEDFPNNQILSRVHNGTINNLLPGAGTGSVQANGAVNVGSIVEVLGLPLPINYSGSFTPGANGTILGTGTWSIGANDFGVTGSGTWNTHRLNDTPGAVAGPTFRLDSNNNRLWNAPPAGDSVFNLGNPADIPVAGVWQAGTDFDNVGMFRNGQWFLDTGNQKYEGPLLGDLQYVFGTTGDKPVVGDWDADGDDDLGVFRAGKFYLDANGNHVWDGVAGGDKYLPFGSSTDIPVVGDWNGDGHDDIGIFRNVGNSGRFYLDSNGDGAWSGPTTDSTFVFGSANDKPVAGDWDGDGDDDIGVVRGGKWYLDQNGNHAWNGTAGGDVAFNFGSSTDRPLVGRWKPNDIPLLPPPPASLPPSIASAAISGGASSPTITAAQLAVPAKSKATTNPIDDVFTQLVTRASDI